MKSISEAGLYGILDMGYVAEDGVPAMTLALTEAGVDVLQLRAKGADEAAVERLGRVILPITRAAGVPLIINDFPASAARLGAEGVHVGQEDEAVARARAVVGPGKIVGKSTHSLAQAEAAVKEGADYIGFGPLFPTPTKPGRPAIGLDEVAEVHRRVSLPIFCIGGVKLENLDVVLGAGARRVVIVSGLLQAADVAGYGRAVRGRMGK